MASCAGRARRASVASPQRPHDASCAPNPCTPSRRAADARRRRGSCPRPIDPLLDLHRERIHPRPRPHRNRQPATGLITGAHPVRDGLVITPGQLRRTAQRAGQVKRLQDLHHFLRALQAGPSARASKTGRAGAYRPIRTDSWGEPMATGGENRRPPAGRTDGRLRGDSHGRRQDQDREATHTRSSRSCTC